MTNELASWLLAQIGEDELAASQAASETGDPRWRALGCDQCAGHVATVKEADREWPQCIAECYPHEGGGLSAPVHYFMASWDPARVLSECDTKRRIVGRHKPRLAVEPEGPLAGQLICGCSDDSNEFLAVRWPCADIRAIASVYEDRPGYREEWRL